MMFRSLFVISAVFIQSSIQSDVSDHDKRPSWSADRANEDFLNGLRQAHMRKRGNPVKASMHHQVGSVIFRDEILDDEPVKEIPNYPPTKEIPIEGGDGTGFHMGGIAAGIAILILLGLAIYYGYNVYRGSMDDSGRGYIRVHAEEIIEDLEKLPAKVEDMLPSELPDVSKITEKLPEMPKTSTLKDAAIKSKDFFAKSLQTISNAAKAATSGKTTPAPPK